MKRYVLMSFLLVSMFACPAVLSQEFEPEDMEIRRDAEDRAGAAKAGTGTRTGR